MASTKLVSVVRVFFKSIYGGYERTLDEGDAEGIVPEGSKKKGRRSTLF